MNPGERGDRHNSDWADAINDSALARFERAKAADPGNGAVRDAIREALSARAAAAGVRGLGVGHGNPEPGS